MGQNAKSTHSAEAESEVIKALYFGHARRGVFRQQVIRPSARILAGMRLAHSAAAGLKQSAAIFLVANLG
jgi:hypothetical protein